MRSAACEDDGISVKTVRGCGAWQNNYEERGNYDICKRKSCRHGNSSDKLE